MNLSSLFIERISLSLLYCYSIPRTLPKTRPQAITICLADQFRLPTDHLDRTLSASIHTFAAAIASFFIDLDNISQHHLQNSLVGWVTSYPRGSPTTNEQNSLVGPMKTIGCHLSAYSQRGANTLQRPVAAFYEVVGWRTTVFHHKRQFNISAKSSSAFVTPAIPNSSTSTLATVGDRNAGSVGPT